MTEEFIIFTEDKLTNVIKNIITEESPEPPDSEF